MHQWRESLRRTHSELTISEVASLPGQIGFHLVPGAGAERASFVLRTRNHEDWSGSWSCKTQYAARPSNGGIANFRLTHLRLVAALDAGAQLSLVRRVYDDGGYWETRSLDKLLANLKHNEEVVGMLHELAQGMLPPGSIHQPR